MSMLSALLYGRRGQNRRTPRLQIELATRILDQRHEQDVISRVQATFGARASLMLPVDLSRNTLLSHAALVARAYHRPPLATGLPADLARALGDSSASTLIERYGRAGGHPLPTRMRQTGARALVYRIGVGYAGALLEHAGDRIQHRVIPPDELELVWGDDCEEPTEIRHAGTRTLAGQRTRVVEVYDLSDLDAPSYRVYRSVDDMDSGREAVTKDIFGRTFDGPDYPWRDPDGRPYHRVVITGDDRDPYRTLSLVEATLIVACRWSAWGVGTDHASHPQRNVRGLLLVGADSDAGDGTSGETGIAVGAETVLRWQDEDPEKPGSHWQDAPAFDPELLAKAIRIYEQSAMAALGIPISLENTGGEPTETERLAREELIAGTLDECRRFDAARLQRSAWYAESLVDTDADFPAGDYAVPEDLGVLYRDEIDEALGAVEPEVEPEPDDDGEPDDESEEEPDDG